MYGNYSLEEVWWAWELVDYCSQALSFYTCERNREQSEHRLWWGGGGGGGEKRAKRAKRKTFVFFFSRSHPYRVKFLVLRSRPSSLAILSARSTIK